MPVPTVNLTVTALDASAQPIAGALVAATLTRTEVYESIIVASTVSAVANGSGVAVLAVFPNALGSSGSQYTVTIRDPNKKGVTTVIANVPNNNCNLADIAALPPYPGKPDGQVSVESAAADAAAAAVSAAAADASADLALGATNRVLSAMFSGGFSVIPVGEVVYLPVTLDCTITGWTLVGDVVGSAVIDVWKAPNAIPTVGNTIAGSEKPTLSAAQLASDNTLTTWSVAVTAGDILAFRIDSASGVKRLTLTLSATLT